MNIYARKAIALLVTATIAQTAMASNSDVNNFLTKMDNAQATPSRHDLYNEAVNAFDNLNQRDRMVVAGIADKTPYEGAIRDVIGDAEARGHQGNVPQGWDVAKTQAFLRAAHSTAASQPVMVQSRMATASTATGGTAHDHLQDAIEKSDVTHLKNMVDTAQFTADSAMSNTAMLNGKVDTLDKSIMDVDTRVDGVEHTANHANTNANAALHMIKNADDAIVQNQKSIAQVVSTVTGEQLAQANRDRTASQHVTPVVGHDGVDGKNGTDGKDGVTTTITRLQMDTATQQQVSANTDNVGQNRAQLRSVRTEQVEQGEHLAQMDQMVSRSAVVIGANAQHIDVNSQHIEQNRKAIQETQDDLKRGLNNAAAMTGLHYHSNDAYAVSAGTANGDGAALAGGFSHSLTQHTAATLQASTSMDGGWMASAGFSGDF